MSEPCKYKLPSLDAESLAYLVECSKHFALMNGILKRPSHSLDSSEIVTYVPHTLFPSPIPKRLYDAANQMQDSINELMLKVANDREFLTSSLKSAISVDDFTARLFNIYEQVEKENLKKPISLCVVRPDYMIDTTGPELALKQVEINTMAAGMGGIGMQVAELHRYNVGLCDAMHAQVAGNKAVMAIGEGAAKAWELYGQPKAWVLFLISVREYNVFDQSWLEHTMRQYNPSIRVIRRTLNEVGQRATITKDRRLIIDGKEIALVYFRIGYAPSQYPTETEWNARLMIERSLAVACPSINWHLAGTKKIQEALSKPGVLERFLSDTDVIARIRSTFVQQYDLALVSNLGQITLFYAFRLKQGQVPLAKDILKKLNLKNEEGDAAAAMGIKNPEGYVLKPQREGGGNNLYDNELRAELERLSGREERGAYILMEKICGQEFMNYEVRGLVVEGPSDMITEYGPFGVILSRGDEILFNKTTGYYMKSHNVSIAEGGISIGSASMDSVALV